MTRFDTTQGGSAERAPVKPIVFGMTDRGRVREGNEDQFLISILRKAMRVQQCSFALPEDRFAHEEGHLWLVADGMGGHAGGETASLLATEAIEEFALNALKWFFHLKGAEGSELLLEFEQALRRADHQINQEAHIHPELHGMGTTVTVVFLIDGAAFVLHVGDSRCYLLKNGWMTRVTTDHTLRQLLAEKGKLDESRVDPARLDHILTNVVGGTTDGIHVDIHKVRVEPGDQILLCSDGLNAMLDDIHIRDILVKSSTPEAACRALIDAANERGGEDNITAIVAHFEAIT